jgi:hypothetical protein
VVRINELAVRPMEEAMCVALMTSGTAGRVQIARLTEGLLDGGRVELLNLLEVAQDLHASRMIELLWPRLTARLRRAA